MTSVRLALYATALAGALLIGPRGPVYWDSFGYVAQALSGQVGGLALGRPLFVLISHAIAGAYRGTGGSVWAIEPVLRTFWLAVAALASPFTHALAERCGLGRRAALIAGVAVALSPAFAHTSSAVLTDAPAAALTIIAFVLMARAVGDASGLGTEAQRKPVSLVANRSLAWAFAAGGVLGVAFGVREQSAVQLLGLALMIFAAGKPSRVAIGAVTLAGFIIAAGAPLAYLTATQRAFWQLAAGWSSAMRAERAGHATAARDVALWTAWVLALGPAVTVAAAIAWTRRWRQWFALGTLRGAIALPALGQMLLLVAYPDIAYSPRYLLPVLCGALAIPGATVIDAWIGSSRRRAAMAVAALVLPLIIASPVVHARERALRDAIDATPAMLANVPARSVVVTGQVCPAVELVQRTARLDATRTIARHDEWQTVCPGWGWPADLTARLDRARREGRPLVLDLRDRVWLGPGQRARLDEVRAYSRAHAAERATGALIVWE